MTAPRPFIFHPTPEPGVFIAQRDGGSWHVLQNVGTPWVLCRTCKAAEHGIDCWAVNHAARHSKELIEEGKTMSQSESTTAVAIAQRSHAVVKATETRLSVAEHLEAWNGLVAMGKAHLATGLAPRGLDTPEKCGLVLLKAMELGVPLTTAYEFFYVTGGRIGVMGQMVRALVESKLPGEGYIHVESSSPMKAVCVGYRQGRKPARVTWTIDDAKRAGLLKNQTWQMYPEDHLVAKASARVGRRMFADVLGGMVVVDHGVVVDSMDNEEAEGHVVSGTEEVIEGEYIVTSTAVHADGRGGGEEFGDSSPAPAAEEPAIDAEFIADPLPPRTELSEAESQELHSLLAAKGLTPSDLSAALQARVTHRAILAWLAEHEGGLPALIAATEAAMAAEAAA